MEKLTFGNPHVPGVIPKYVKKSVDVVNLSNGGMFTTIGSVDAFHSSGWVFQNPGLHPWPAIHPNVVVHVEVQPYSSVTVRLNVPNVPEPPAVYVMLGEDCPLVIDHPDPLTDHA